MEQAAAAALTFEGEVERLVASVVVFKPDIAEPSVKRRPVTMADHREGWYGRCPFLSVALTLPV